MSFKNFSRAHSAEPRVLRINSDRARLFLLKTSPARAKSLFWQIFGAGEFFLLERQNEREGRGRGKRGGKEKRGEEEKKRGRNPQHIRLFDNARERTHIILHTAAGPGLRRELHKQEHVSDHLPRLPRAFAQTEQPVAAIGNDQHVVTMSDVPFDTPLIFSVAW